MFDPEDDHRFSYKPSDGFRSKKKSKKNNTFQFLKIENNKLLSYHIPEQLKELRDIKNKQNLFLNGLSKHLQGMELNKISPDTIKEIAAKMGVQNLQVTEQMLQEVRNRVVKLQQTPRQNKRKGPSL